jgi:hypothetical protein
MPEGNGLRAPDGGMVGIFDLIAADQAAVVSVEGSPPFVVFGGKRVSGHPPTKHVHFWLHLGLLDIVPDQAIALGSGGAARDIPIRMLQLHGKAVGAFHGEDAALFWVPCNSVSFTASWYLNCQDHLCIVVEEKLSDFVFILVICAMDHQLVHPT